MTNTEKAAKFYAVGKISAWNNNGQSVRVLIGAKWWPMNAHLVASLERDGA